MYSIFYIKIQGLNQLNYKSVMNGSICIVKVTLEQKIRELGNLRYKIKLC